MFPVLFEVFGVPIHSYGFFIGIGYLAALAVGYFLAKKSGQNFGYLIDLAFLSVIAGLIGARIAFVLTNLNYYSLYPLEIFSPWRGGLVFYGGLITAVPLAALYIKWRKLPTWTTLDIMSCGLLVGHAVGRIGCFAAGCCHGSACHDLPWCIVSHSSLVDPALRGVLIHPVQLYESGALFLLSGALFYLFLVKKAAPGVVSITYVGVYALIRFTIEFFRGDSVRGFIPGTGISTSQGISLAIIAVCMALLARRLRSNH